MKEKKAWLGLLTGIFAVFKCTFLSAIQRLIRGLGTAWYRLAHGLGLLPMCETPPLLNWLASLLMWDAVGRYVLGLRKLTKGFILAWSRCHIWSYTSSVFLVFHETLGESFSLTDRSYFWSGWVIAVQSSEMDWAGGCSLQCSPMERDVSIWEWGHPTAFLSPSLASTFTLASETEEGDFPRLQWQGFSSGTGSSK